MSISLSALAGCPLEIKRDETAIEPKAQPAAPPAVGIVATERAVRGGRLVLISQSGERMRAITEIGPVPVRDNGAAWSPDGRYVAFASSRVRDSVDETSLWVVSMEKGARPRRLTRDQRAVDRDPVWAPDGRSLLFSSNRAGHFDLYRLPLREREDGPPMAAGEPVALTSGPTLDFHPSPEPGDGRIAFMRVDTDGQRSRIFIVDGGQVVPLTAGPADVTPAWSPDGRRVAFAAPGPEGDDADLYVLAVDAAGAAGEPELVVAEPLADQTGPVWSSDGRYVFCTSIFRSEKTGRPVFASVTFADLSESQRVLRALHSRIATDARMEPTLERRMLDARELRGNLPYRDALQRSVESDLLRAAEAAERMRRSQSP